MTIAAPLDHPYAATAVPPERSRVTTAHGAYAEAGRFEGGHETIRVLSPHHELLFEYDPETGTTRLVVPAGRLELIAARGDLVLRSGATVRLEGNAVEVRGRQSIVMAVARGVLAASTWLRLLPTRAQLDSERVELRAEETETRITKSCTMRGGTAVTEVQRYELKAGAVETDAASIVERAGNVYRTVRELVQVQAGRLRTLVLGTSHFRSKQAHFSSEESFHIDGDKIHLG